MKPAGLADSAVKPYVWTNESYLALVRAGIVPEGHGIELVDGLIVETMSQGERHWFIFAALQRIFASMGGFEHGLAVQPTVVLEQGNVFDPEFAFLRPDRVGKLGLPTSSDILHVIEVSVTSRSQDLGPKKAAYAAAGIPCYWVVDGIDRGLWVFSDPESGVYRDEAFVTSEGQVTVPVLGLAMPLEDVFPPAV